MTNRRLIAVALVAVGVAAVIVGAVKLLSDSHSDSEATRASGSLSTDIANAVPAAEPFSDLTALALEVGDRCMRLVVADSLDERVAGLRQRSDIGAYDGMLFVFDSATDTAFTMSTVPVSLDIGFYDADGRLVSTRHMKPCAKAEDRCPVYRSDGLFAYALETLKGKLPVGSIGAPCPS